jgi:hypothetical protein
VDFRYAINLLGRPADDPDVRALLERLKIIREPEIDVDENDEITTTQDWLINRLLGVELGFQLKSEALGEGLLGSETDVLILNQVYFYGHHADVEPYRGRFPFDLTLDDDRAMVRQRLAAHERTRRSYTRDCWEPPAFRFVVGYVDGGAHFDGAICVLRIPPLPADADDAALVPALDRIVGVLGKPLNDPQLRLVFAPLRIGPKLIQTAAGARADFTDHVGLELDFSHASGRRDLALTTVLFYRDHVRNSARWPGALPYGLTFDDSPEVMFSKVGRPPDVHSDETFTGNAIWKTPEFTLNVLYSSFENFILRVQLFAPGAYNFEDEQEGEDGDV